VGGLYRPFFNEETHVIKLAEDLFSLYERNEITICEKYRGIVLDNLIADLSYTSPIMEGIVRTVFNSKKMMAFNLIQNAIDEAKGAARVRIIAERYADKELREKMLKHVNDEMNHSSMFAELVQYTGYEVETEDFSEHAEEINSVFDFDDDLKQFICRVHSIEVRSWTMLRHYLNVLNELQDEKLLKMKPAIEKIMRDEINHVCYTGQTVSNWLEEDESLCQIFVECINHTNKETWQDLTNMSQFMYDNIAEIMKEAA
jgi:rubrerythrin